MSTRKRLTFILTSALLLSASIGIPLYFVLNPHSDNTPESLFPQITLPTNVNFYSWQNISLTFGISTNTTYYNASFHFNQSPDLTILNGSMETINFSYAPLMVGVYNVSLTVTDEVGRTSQVSLEIEIFLDGDEDQDNLFDHQELWQFHTDPTQNDTDGDDLTDNVELYTYTTDPTNDDSDGDSLLDGEEVFIYGTNPSNADSDSDGLPDDWELFVAMTNPLSPHSDTDNCDDFSELFFFNTNPLLDDCTPPVWEGGTIRVFVTFQVDVFPFIPFCEMEPTNKTEIPRLLYLYVRDRVKNQSQGEDPFYIVEIERLAPIRILVIDNFNSESFIERQHGQTCVNILEDTITNLVGMESKNENFEILEYSVSELDRNWGTALEYAIEQGVDVISISQVISYGSVYYFEDFNHCVNTFEMIISTGTGNDDRGDPTTIGTSTLRYPAIHPDTLVVGGVVLNDATNQWERWEDENTGEGSNWGRSSLSYNGTVYYSAVEIVANCHRSIFFQDYYGVSWAIPNLAGISAVLRYDNEFLTPADVRRILLTTATPITPTLYNYGDAPFENGDWWTGWNAEVGYGMPNIQAARIQAVIEVPN